MEKEKFLIMCDSVKNCQDAILKNLNYNTDGALNLVQYALSSAWGKMRTAERDAMITAIMEVLKKVKRGEEVWEQEFIRL